MPGLLVVRIVEKQLLSTGQAGPGQKKIPLKQSGLAREGFLLAL